MIEIKDLTYTYPSYAKDPDGIRDINLSVSEGEFIVLTGQSGCGKTTLTRVLNGLCPKFYGGMMEGHYVLDGKDTAGLDLNEIGLQTGSVFQDPRSQFFAVNTTDEIVLAMENRCFPPQIMRNRLMEMADLLDIHPLLNKSLFTLSSGEKQKIAIAAACSVKPKVLILDEPTANLDAHASLQLAEILKILKTEGYTIIISEHRLYYLKNLFDRMIVMENGKIKTEFTADEANSLSDQDYKQMGLRLPDIPTLDWPVSAAVFPADAFLKADHICYTVQKQNVLHDLSMTLSPGKIIALTGKNGAGKTTSCRILSGLLKEQSGTVTMNSRSLHARHRAKQSFFVQQDADYQLFAPSVKEELTLNLPGHSYTQSEVTRLLDTLSLTAFADRHPGSLSGGQKQRVLLAAAIMRKVPLLILDEPTSGLDGKNMRNMAQLLGKIAELGTCILLITHDVEFLALAADLILHLEDGAISRIYSRPLASERKRW